MITCPRPRHWAGNRCLVLGQIGSAQALGALRAALADPDRWVRIHAGLALAQHGVPAGFPGAKAALYEGPQWLKCYAIYGLYKIGTPAARQVLKSASAQGNQFLTRILKAALDQEKVQPPQGPVYDEPLVAHNWVELLDRAGGALVDEADAWFHNGDYDQAVRCNEAALFLQPDWVDLYGANGWLQWSMNYHGAAISTYRRGIAANPGAWEPCWELGFYYFLQKRTKKAVRYLKDAMDCGAPPMRVRSYAHALEKTGQLSEALKVWQELDKVDASAVVDVNLNRLKQIIAGDN